MILPDSVSRALAACESQYPYLSAALDAMPVIVTDKVPTAACSQTGAIYINEDFLRDLEKNESGGIIAHEVWHYLSEHFRRIGDRNPQAWNIATDAEINDDLGCLPPGCVTPSLLDMPDGLLAEEYIGSDNIVEVPIQVCGSASDGEAKEWEDDADGMTDEIADQMRDRVAEGIKSAGLKGSIETWATERLKVAVPPLGVRLRDAASKTGATPLGADLTYAKPSRRQRRPIVSPGVRKENKSVMVLVDTSGSIAYNNDSRVSGAVQSVARSYGEINWAMADTEIRNRGRGTLPREFTGGGGTDMRSCLKVLDTEGHNLLIVVTDGDTPWPAKDEISTPYCAVLVEDCSVPEHVKYVVVEKK